MSEWLIAVAYALGAVAWVTLATPFVWRRWRKEFPLTASRNEAAGVSLFLSLYWPLVLIALLIYAALRQVTQIVATHLLKDES